jgi:acetylglutamate kinase
MANVTVVKIGGSTLGANDTSLEDLAKLWRDGERLVVVHGGGAILSEWLRVHGVESRFVRGLRVTDRAAIDVAVAVFAGVVNTELVARLNSLGARALGLSGVDGALIRAERFDPELGYVGRVREVDRAQIETLLDAGYLPVIASLAVEVEGELLLAQPLNVNADTVAGDVAAALEAERLVFLTDVPGVLDAQGEVIRRLSRDGALELIESGVAQGGMIPKIEAALVAAAAGARAFVVDGREPHALREALSGSVRGTEIGG